MTAFAPDPRLCNLPRHVFECFGKPNVGAFYAGKSVSSHVLEEGALCACCGRIATNAHHWPPGRSTVKVGGRVLRPSLFAVCGSGTTGCHDGWHGGARFKALWRWDEERYFDDWADGRFWEEGFFPHSPELYLFGCWELYDLKEGRIWTIREE